MFILLLFFWTIVLQIYHSLSLSLSLNLFQDIFSCKLNRKHGLLNYIMISFIFYQEYALLNFLNRSYCCYFSVDYSVKCFMYTCSFPSTACTFNFVCIKVETKFIQSEHAWIFPCLLFFFFFFHYQNITSGKQWMITYTRQNNRNFSSPSVIILITLK